MAQPIIGYAAFWQPSSNTGRIYLRVGDAALPDDVELAIDSPGEFSAMVDLLGKHANVGYDDENKLIMLHWRKPGTM